jgi:hypothetical protein
MSPRKVVSLTTEKVRREVGELLKMLLYATEQKLGVQLTLSKLLPIDVAEIASLLGFRIEKVEELGGVLLNNPWAGVNVSGRSDGTTGIITIAGKQPPEQQRFTIAHEICHQLLHSGAVHHRERPTPGRRNRIPEEREAEAFAAELTMPVEPVRDAMLSRFGTPIDGTLPRDDLAYFLSLGTGQHLEAKRLAQMPQIHRANLVARANNFREKHFDALHRVFGVSVEAMGYRLLELDLVS